MNHRITWLQFFSRLVWLALILLALSSAMPARAATVTITVTNTNDSGAGSLRQAIADAAAGDTINFGLTYPATIVLTSGQLKINKNLTISGPGASHLTISGNDSSRVFNVNAGVNVTISGVTIADGKVTLGSGGGIFNGGALTVTDSTLANNNAESGAGIYNDNYAIATVTRSTFSGNSAKYGGGIFNNDYGTLTVNSSTFSDNVAPSGSTYGGGIDTEGPATVTNSTFTGNRATYGGGIGVFKSYGNLTVVNCTFSNNSASQGSGLHKDGSAVMTIKNTIVANSAAGGNCFGTATAASTNNLSTDASCTTGFTQVTSLQLALGALTGAPAYFPLNVGSVAMDAGTNTDCPATDQRGVARPQDGDGNGSAICDVGSFEYTRATNFLYLPLILR
jgi:hypothetical protein